MSEARLNIAMLSVHSCPVGRLGSRDTGGMSVYVRELAAELAARGHSVDLFTRAHDPNDERIVEIGDRARVIHLRAGEIEQVHKLVLYARLDDFACSVENFRKREELRYDLVHSHYWLSGWVGRQLRVWWNVPHVAMFHTLGAVKNTIGVGEEEPDLRVVTEVELAASADRIIAATDAERAALSGLCRAAAEKISVIPCGVNLASFRHVGRREARRRLGLNGDSLILYVGRIEPLKGVDRLLEAVSLLDRERTPRLVVVGGGAEEEADLERLKGTARSLGVEDSVVFAGIVPHEDLFQYYNAADLCVVPSYYESFGLVALEALACGTPVVATRVGGIEALVRQGETGYVARGDSPLDLADGIAAVLSGSDGEMAAAGAIRASVEDFTWSNVAEAVLKEYAEVLRGSCAPVA